MDFKDIDIVDEEEDQESSNKKSPAQSSKVDESLQPDPTMSDREVFETTSSV